MRPAAPLALLLAAMPAWSQVCVPTSSGGRAYRPAMTHRGQGPTAEGISVATLQAWSPPDGVEDERVRARDAAIDPREERSVTLEADLWRVKVGDDGCALRLELAATRAGNDSPHVVAVIPSGEGYDAARAAIWAAVGRQARRRPGRVDLAAPVHVRLTGRLFWDGEQWCPESPARGCGRRAEVVASLWELRPVWRVEVTGAAEPVPVEREGDDTTGHHRHHRHHHRRHRDEAPARER
ncbi:MAG: hypothetical protein Q8S73_22195 [Deltaproteobacteria bacterium]|nr:hypothetical protein [Myxococcales bacterium]MDP3216837.1 hypothetical protein [Deltaproteobacteria bacterium]